MSDVVPNKSILSLQTPTQDKINIYVGEKQDACLVFMTQRNHSLGIVMNNYAKRIKCLNSEISFFYNDMRLDETSKPAELGMEDQDFVQVIVARPKKENPTTAMTEDDKKVQDPNTVMLNVKGMDGSIVEIQIPKKTTFFSAIDSYCSLKGFEMDEINFVYNERVISTTETPEDLHFKSVETVEVQKKTEIADEDEGQTENFGTPVSATTTRENPASATPDDENTISIKVVGCDNAIVRFKVKRDAPLGRLIDKYCEHANVDESGLRFMFDDTRINRNTTPNDLEMEEGDSIDVYQKQDGGFELYP